MLFSIRKNEENIEKENFLPFELSIKCDVRECCAVKTYSEIEILKKISSIWVWRNYHQNPGRILVWSEIWGREKGAGEKKFRAAD